MDETLLEKLGLTKGEIKVYLALNKLGESSIGPIGKESKVSKSKMYDILDKLIEIQIRTVLQHLWAEFSEKLSDHDPGIKYGAGNRDIQYRLINLSRIISKFENIELKVTDLLTKSTTDEKIKLKLESFQQEMDVDKESIIKSLKDIISFDSKKEIP